MSSLMDQLAKHPIIPVIQLDKIEDVEPLAQTLCDNGMPVAEVTLRSPIALDAIKIIARKFPQMLLIAGTVLNPVQAQQAVEAGASAIVSPGFNPQTIQYCIANGISIIPGVATPGEMEQAMGFGLKQVKFFPAESLGGVAFLKAVSAPYQQLKFMPTGGINPSNAQSYLDLDCVICCGSSWMVNRELVQNHEWDKVAQLVRETVDTFSAK